MNLGVSSIPPVALLIGGTFLLLVLGTQILIGYRKIPLKRGSFAKVHKRVAWVVLALSLAHGFGGVLFVLSLR